MAPKTVIFVVGMSRSGTSALTRVLSLCGCQLPAVLLGATDRNPRGEWEPVESLKMNDTFLVKSHTNPFDPMFANSREDPETRSVLRAELLQGARKFLADCVPGGGIALIKDLRITMLLDIWAEAAIAESFDVKVVIALREPQEAVASMVAFGHPQVLSYALWLKYNLLAERSSRGYSRVVIEYSNLLNGWQEQVTRAANVLQLPLHLKNAEAVASFLTKDLYRHRRAGPIEEVFGVEWISRAYAALATMARDGDARVEKEKLDEIYTARVTCENALRMSSAEYERYHPGIFLQDTLRQPHWRAGQDF